MISSSTLLHLRFPFSFFLLPVYLFALALSPNFYGDQLLWSFLIIHVLLYPASNGYNSYFDKDEKSIALIKNPPPVKRELYVVSILLDVLAVILSYFMINVEFSIGVLLYGLISKAYSHPAIRIKKYPIASWLIVVVFQGFYSLLLCYIGINKFGVMQLGNDRLLWAGVLSSMLLFASYPLTQVYQHEEDARRGDKTMSMLLGIRGTFYFALIFFTVAIGAFVLYFLRYFDIYYGVVFIASQTPLVVFFFYWFARVLRDPKNADYKGTMIINLLSGICLNGFFVWLFIDTSHVLEAFP